MIHIIILNYKPDFNDGRVSRVSSLVDYLADKNKIINIYSLSGESNISQNGNVKHFQIKYPGLGFISLNKVTGKELSARAKLTKYISKILYPDRYVLGSILIYKKLSKELSDNDTIFISVPWFSILFLLFFKMERFNE